jgi:tRNA-Thr(GGU) m(6)t(6)A37 methyltransferase TsaA
MSSRAPDERNLVRRHDVIVLSEHWVIAVSGLTLVLTGLFELPIARRYFITEIPGLRWSGDYIFSLWLHYAFSVVFVAACLFHVVYHGLMGHRAILPRQGDLRESWAVVMSFFGKGGEPPFEKYLPEQRLAYAGIAVIIAGLIASGLVKTWKNLFAPDMDLAVVLWATWVHNLFFILFVMAFIAHIAAILIRPNRPMIRAILTGWISRDYAERRHPLWVSQIEGQRHPAQAVQAQKASPGAGRITYAPIGVIRSLHTDPEKTPIQSVYAQGCTGRAEVMPEYAEGLKDLEGFSHLILIYHFHRAGPVRLIVRPFLQDIDRGVFSTRAPCRPNPIGLSIVKLVRREGCTLHLDGVDILDETPLLDIKPYVGRFDRIETTSDGWHREVDEPTARLRGRRGYVPHSDPEGSP